MPIVKIEENAPNATARVNSVTFDDESTYASTSEDRYVGNEQVTFIDPAVNSMNSIMQNSQLRMGVAEDASKALASGNSKVAVRGMESDTMVDGYAVMSVEDAQVKPFSGQAVISAYTALEEGYSEDEIKDYISRQGMDADAVFSMLPNVKRARDAGYDDEAIAGFLTRSRASTVTDTTTEYLSPAVRPEDISDKYLETEVDPKFAAASRLLNPNAELTVQELVASMEVVYPNMTTVTTRASGFFGNQEAQRKADEASVQSAQKIVNLAKSKYDIDLQWSDGQFFVNTAEGLVPATPGIMENIAAEKGELIGAISGGIGGGLLGARAPTQNPYLKGLATLVASAGGAVAGSIAGTEFDYLTKAMELQVDFDAEVAAHKAVTASEASIIGDVVGFGVLKGLGVGWRGIQRVKNFVADGNSEGAYQALKETMFVSDDEAREIVQRFNKVQVEPLVGTEQKQAIVAVATTQPGSDFLVRAAGLMDPQAGRSVVKAIDDRAKDLLAVANDLSDDNIGRILQQDLVGYTSDVKNFYDVIKMQAAKSPNSGAFSFDYEALAINPVLERLQKNITDPTVLQRFLLQAQKIRATSDSRTFSDLIELRQLVNEFKFNKRISSAKDFDALNDVLGEIDTAIKQGAEVVQPGNDAKTWLANWALARAEYGKMKSLERNVLAKLLNRKGISEDLVVKGLTRYINSIDGTFVEVMEKLPKGTRTKVEGAIINSLSDKYTAGIGEGIRAVNFPLLADELNMIQFKSAESRQFKRVVQEFAELFKNDVPLAQSSGQIQIPKFQSYLTTDPVVRAKFEIASSIFNKVKTLAPGQTQRNMALVNNLSSVLEQPLSTKAMRDLMEAAAGDVDVAPQVLELQRAAARQAAEQLDTEASYIKLYGEGAVKAFKGDLPSGRIRPHRVATNEIIKTVAEAEGINISDRIALDFALKQRGYVAAQYGSDRVRVLK